MTPGTYRPDIDGLRAVAVGLVVLFHADVPGIGGGFVGVDVFFVISGYLIGTILLRDLVGGRMSLLEFYERRARRILPALYVVLAVCSLAAAALMLPADLQVYGRSLRGTVTYLSNVFFYRHAGYFEDPAALKPLLHTWSLSVEEQFYLVVPVLLLVLTRFAPRRLTLILGGLWVLSLGASIWKLDADRDGVFYLFQYRAWELLTGTLLAAVALKAPGPRVAAAAGIAGLGAILGAAFGLAATSDFPAQGALLPCLGTALLIYSGSNPQAPVARLLRLGPVVGFGLISYSLYIWHWPMLALARYASVGPLHPAAVAAVVALAVIVAYASWRWVEQPFRHRGAGAPVSARGIAVMAIGGAVVLGAFGVLANRQAGWPGRMPEPVLQFAAGRADVWEQRHACMSVRGAAAVPCLIGDPAASTETFAVIGDSFAVALGPALESLAAEHRVRGVLLAGPGCIPALGVLAPDGQPVRCTSIVESALERVRGADSIRTVVLIGRWARMTEGTRPNEISRTPEFYIDRHSAAPGVEENRRVLERGLGAMLDALRGKRVVLVASVPEHRLDLPHALAMNLWLGRGLALDLPLADFRARQRAADEVLHRVAKARGLMLLQPAELLCRGGSCKVEHGGRPLYSDAAHLSRAGAEFVRPGLAPIFQP